MGVALDTVLWDVHNTSTSAVGLTTANTTNSGDPAQIRSFDSPAFAQMLAAFEQASGAQQLRITSPRFHDNVTGLTWQPLESPSEFLLPSEVGQPLYSVDTLAVQMAAAASSDSIVATLNYYSDLKGISADLRRPADVLPQMINLKVMEVAVTTSGTIGAWTDTVITTTENQLKADYVYACLGFQESANLCAVGLKGPATGNLRVCIPGASATYPLTEYFIKLSERHNLPLIPCFKANDRGATFISACANTASASSNVYAILAQLPK